MIYDKQRNSIVVLVLNLTDQSGKVKFYNGDTLEYSELSNYRFENCTFMEDVYFIDSHTLII